jgi:hypothetical protein
MQNTLTRLCPYDNSDEDKISECMEAQYVTDIQARPIIDNKFWIVEKNGIKFATLRKNDDNRFVLSNESGIKVFDRKSELTKEFGNDFFIAKIIRESNNADSHSVQDFPTSVIPCNSMYDIKRKLPLFTKSKESKSIYCAGYYIIKYEKGWAKSFCPKLITLQRYAYQGPYNTETEMKQELSNVSR